MNIYTHSKHILSHISVISVPVMKCKSKYLIFLESYELRIRKQRQFSKYGPPIPIQRDCAHSTQKLYNHNPLVPYDIPVEIRPINPPKTDDETYPIHVTSWLACVEYFTGLLPHIHVLKKYQTLIIFLYNMYNLFKFIPCIMYFFSYISKRLSS